MVRTESREDRPLAEGAAHAVQPESRADAADLARLDAARLAAPSAVERFAASAGLTRRQTEVLEHAVSGASNREISEALRCAEVTVEKHLATIFVRAGVRDRARLVLAVLDRGPTREAAEDRAESSATRAPASPAPRARSVSPVERAEAFARRLSLIGRARAVLRLLVRGSTNKEIASVLGYAEVTIETQLTAIYRTARVRGRRELLLAILAE